MPRVYVFTIFLSFVAGLLTAMMVSLGEYKLLVKLLLLIFALIVFNEKIALFENLLSRRERSELRSLGFIVLLMLFLLVIMGVL